MFNNNSIMQDLEVNLMYIVLKGILLNLNFMATFLQGLVVEVVVVVVVVVGGGVRVAIIT